VCTSVTDSRQTDRRATAYNERSLKIIKIVATRSRCRILKLKCTKFDFGWGLQRSPDSLAESKAPYFYKEREGKEGIWQDIGKGMEGRGQDGKGGLGEGVKGKGEGTREKGGRLIFWLLYILGPDADADRFL